MQNWPFNKLLASQDLPIVKVGLMGLKDLMSPPAVLRKRALSLGLILLCAFFIIIQIRRTQEPCTLVVNDEQLRKLIDTSKSRAEASADTFGAIKNSTLGVRSSPIFPFIISCSTRLVLTEFSLTNSSRRSWSSDYSTGLTRKMSGLWRLWLLTLRSNGLRASEAKKSPRRRALQAGVQSYPTAPLEASVGT